MVAAERMAARQKHSQRISVALAGAGTVAAAAAFLATGLRTALGAALVTVCTVGRDGLLHVEHVAGHPDAGAEAFGPMPLTAPLPLTEAARSGRPVWIPDRGVWKRRFPAVAPALLGPTEGAAVLPLAVGDRVLGAVGLTFRTPREFDPEERAFLIALAGQAAVAFERAALADTRREVADTLQHSLLPDRLPSLERLSVTARYLPGQQGTQAGGDWYDVLPLSDGRVALVVGDVVGNGAAAAAVMGQLRSALAMLLLEGHAPARALDLLDRFAARVEGARVSTVAVLLLDPSSGRLTYSRAGHPPPLVLGDDGARALDGALGPALDVSAGSPRRETETWVRPGETLLLYTDGLVERRDAPLDTGLERLAAVTAGLAGAAPTVLVAGVLEGMFDSAGPADDVAVVAARLVPAPLRLELPAVPARLHLLRRALTEWADAAGLGEEALDDLLLAVGEAVANAVEHAYPGGDGSDLVRLTVERDGDVLRVEVADAGTWRPPPADAGFRGRGLQIIRGVASEVELLPGPRGTTLRFRLRARPAAAEGVLPPVPPAASPVAGRPAAVTVSQAGDRRCVQLSGELDLAGVLAVRERLLAAVADGPALLDLTDLDALFSVGMGLVLETLEAAGPELEVLLPEAGPARRALDLTGLTPLLTAPH
jgi:anti-sigma regulatory factor (Ser/Thr protein kinase)/anti-anti-sigma regulatory factor